MKKILNEFKDFIARGNVLDLAIGIIIGSAFTAIVNSLVSDIINPLLSSIIGGFSFESMNVKVKFPWVTALRNAGHELEYPSFNFGTFISAIITFLVTAIALFFIIKGINAFKKLSEKKKQEEIPAAPTTRICPFCRSEVDITATKCKFCTSDLKPEEP